MSASVPALCNGAAPSASWLMSVQLPASSQTCNARQHPASLLQPLAGGAPPPPCCSAVNPAAAWSFQHILQDHHRLVMTVDSLKHLSHPANQPCAQHNKLYHVCLVDPAGPLTPSAPCAKRNYTTPQSATASAAAVAAPSDTNQQAMEFQQTVPCKIIPKKPLQAVMRVFRKHFHVSAWR